MATIDPTTAFPSSVSQDMAVTTWAAMAADDVGRAVTLAQYSDRTVQAAGVFDGGSVVLEGSNDGQTYHTLTDPQGNALSFSAGGLEAVIELPLHVRARVSGGGAATAINMILTGRKSV